MLKRLSAGKKILQSCYVSWCWVFSSGGGMVMKAKPSIKIPFTFSSKKKYPWVQICFLSGGAEGTWIRKMSATGKGGSPSLGHQGHNSSSLTRWLGLLPLTVRLLGRFYFLHLCNQIISDLWKGGIFLHQLFQYPHRISNDVKAKSKKKIATVMTASKI